MSGYLLDTHAAIWYFIGDERLSKTDHLTVLENLPMIHRDPFDRLLIATAIAEEMTLITIDENIAKYEVSRIW